MKISADALLFDMDGTLISSMDSVVRCWTRWAGEYGVTMEDFQRVPLHGRPAAEIVGDLLAPELVAEAVTRVEQLEIEDVAGGVVILPGTKDLLGSLPAGSWAVVTSATRRLAEARLAEVGIEPPVLVCADDITRGKPDPEPFLLGAAKLGFSADRCVVFEDAPAGLTSGRSAGMWTVALATTHERSELAADVVVADLSEVSAQVAGHGVEITAGA